jgi:hypothetical protein
MFLIDADHNACPIVQCLISSLNSEFGDKIAVGLATEEMAAVARKALMGLPPEIIPLEIILPPMFARQLPRR